MTIIVETGAVVAGANSFVSLEDYEDYALALGVETVEEVQLLKAGAYLNSLDRQYAGMRVTRDQAMAWPRIGQDGGNLWLGGFEYLPTEIPAALPQAQLILAMEVQAGTDLYNVETRQVVTSESVAGAVAVSYSDSAGAMGLRQTGAEPLLRGLMAAPGYGIPLIRA